VYLCLSKNSWLGFSKYTVQGKKNKTEPNNREEPNWTLAYYLGQFYSKVQGRFAFYEAWSKFKVSKLQTWDWNSVLFPWMAIPEVANLAERLMPWMRRKAKLNSNPQSSKSLASISIVKLFVLTAKVSKVISSYREGNIETLMMHLGKKCNISLDQNCKLLK